MTSIYMSAYLSVCVVSVCVAGGGPASVDIIAQETGVTVTSAYLNREISVPQWASNAFSYAAYELNNHSQECSLELLGFVKKSTHSGVLFRLRYSHGVASVYAADPQFRAKCLYRKISEKWRRTHKIVMLAYYCPVSNSEICMDLSEKHRHSILFNLRTVCVDDSDDRVYWDNPFRMFINRFQLVDHSPRIAVCSVRPYGTSNHTMETAMQALTWEWLQHYVLLNMRVFLYDRVGVFRSLVEGFDPANEDKIHGIIHYYNSTISAALQYGLPGSAVASIPSSGVNIHEADDDKVFTLTHCRFEARSLFQIENVLVVDTDEFIYCRGKSKSNISYSSQIQGINTLLSDMKTSGAQELHLLQTLPYLAYGVENILDCVVSAVRSNKEFNYHISGLRVYNSALPDATSLFKCFGPISSYAHYFKSISYGFICPATGFHHSCEQRSALNITSNVLNGEYIQGCHCNSRINRVCVAAHFTIVQLRYTRTPHKLVNVRRFKGMQSELYNLIAERKSFQ